uniref:BAF250_C domain-containing protein n=1 Tax=Angiostrongylus cantonensis TaxID=6313 RepID=A0A0K0DFJ6_ANGCA
MGHGGREHVDRGDGDAVDRTRADVDPAAGLTVNKSILPASSHRRTSASAQIHANLITVIAELSRICSLFMSKNNDASLIPEDQHVFTVVFISEEGEFSLQMEAKRIRLDCGVSDSSTECLNHAKEASSHCINETTLDELSSRDPLAIVQTLIRLKSSLRSKAAVEQFMNERTSEHFSPVVELLVKSATDIGNKPLVANIA